MPRAKKRGRSLVPTLESFKAQPLVEVAGTSSPSVASTTDAYQLAVVNSCLTNEDIRLPTVPTPALLSAFYAECDTCVESVSIAATAGLAPWKAAYWLDRVAHVPLGRHSALPNSLRLRHDCVSRLHARVVYVRTSAMHRRFAKFFPCIAREETHEREADKTAQHSIEVTSENEEADVVIVASSSVSRQSTPPPSPLSWTAPYYLIVNYSENPVYVGRQCVPRGRSAKLEEGDVVSFLECAFDDEGGILDEDKLSPAHSEERTTTAVVKHESLAEPTQQLVSASLHQCLPNSMHPMPALPFSLHSSRCLAKWRLFNVPSVVQEYVKWWHAQTHHALAQTSGPDTSLASSSNWLVSGNHLVRARSVANSAAASATSGHPPMLTVGEDSAVPDDTGDSSLFDTCALRDPATAASLCEWLDDTDDMAEVADDVVSPLCAHLALDRTWLRRVAAQSRRSSARQRSSDVRRATAGTHAVKAEGRVDSAGLSPPPVAVVKGERNQSVVKNETKEADGDSCVIALARSSDGDVAESFRVSSSPLRGPAAPQTFATPPREASVVQAVLDELRRSRNEGNASAPPLSDLQTDRCAVSTVTPSCVETGLPVRRSLRLEEDPIELFTSTSVQENAESAAAEARADDDSGGRTSWVNGSVRSYSVQHAKASGGAVKQATGVPGVCLETAVLPVYVFARRCRSPDVYTRDRAALRPFTSSPSREKALASAATAAQYVYYFEPEEKAEDPPKMKMMNVAQKSWTASASDLASLMAITNHPQPTGKDVQASDEVGIAANASVARFEWIDESEQGGAVKKKKKTKRRRRRLP